MRLLRIIRMPKGEGLEVSLCEYIDTEAPPYMILSHRWREEEVLFADMTEPDLSKARKKKGFEKIKLSCRIAAKRGLRYIWIDTCCINKNSSAELSQAINAMYSYYAKAEFCLAYLDDIDSKEDMKDSVWFTRGWTLQELIAPEHVVFHNKHWKELGSKASLSCHVSAATGIAEAALISPNAIERVCISEKMSWAAKRSTTHPEDEAYSLMGIFQVSFSPIYGEGRERAFRRLQLEIIQITSDQTIFAWFSSEPVSDMLAPNVRYFTDGDRYEPLNHESYVHQVFFRDITKPDHNMTNVGLFIQLPLWELSGGVPRNLLAVLSCRIKGASWYLGVYLHSLMPRRSYRIAINRSTTSLIPQSQVETMSSTSSTQIWISGLPYPHSSHIEWAPWRLKQIFFKLEMKLPWKCTSVHCRSCEYSLEGIAKFGRQEREDGGGDRHIDFVTTDGEYYSTCWRRLAQSEYDYEVISVLSDVLNDNGFEFGFGVINGNSALGWFGFGDVIKPGYSRTDYNRALRSFHTPIGWLSRRRKPFIRFLSIEEGRTSFKQSVGSMSFEVAAISEKISEYEYHHTLRLQGVVKTQCPDYVRLARSLTRL